MFPSPGSSIEGYLLVRKIGEGGFGEVWLVKSETTGAWKALKWISKASHRHLDQELGAISRYSQAISSRRSSHLLPIEHVRLLEDGLVYVMPLADGFDGLSPEDENWEPVTLAGIMARHRLNQSWLTLGEIKGVIDGVLEGAAIIAETELQHRDIKPENIIFIGGDPALGDFGLATEDVTQVSMRGTPHHAAPSWYLETGGNSDQWGVAILLYQLLTGNSADKIGKPKYLQPEKDMGDLTKAERDEWNRLQSLVNRATSEVPRERFIGAEAFRKAIFTTPHGTPSSEPEHPLRRKNGKHLLVVAGVAIIALLASSSFIRRWGSISHPSSVQNISTSRTPAQTDTQSDSTEPRWRKEASHIYSRAEVEQINELVARGDNAGMEKLNKANEERYWRVVHDLPSNAIFSDVTEKMRFP